MEYWYITNPHLPIPTPKTKLDMKRLLFILATVFVSNLVNAQIDTGQERVSPPIIDLCPIGETKWYPDNDGDGFGRATTFICSENMPIGPANAYVANHDDCNDNDATITNQGVVQYSDVDNDGLGDPNSFITSCFIVNGYVTNGNDQCPTVYGTNNGCPVTPPSTNENYIQTTNYQVPVETQSQINALSNDDKIESITYYDDLGRPKQSIAKQGGGNHQDIVMPVVYDGYGRKTKEYLPYANPNQSASSATLNFRETSTLIGDIETYYGTKFPEDIDTSAPNPYSEKIFEASPLNKVLEEAAPGRDWKADANADTDHTIKLGYETNAVNTVPHYNAIFPTGNTEVPQLSYNGSHAENQLYKSIVKDENWSPSQTHLKDHTTEEFKNRKGQVVLKRTYNEGIAHDTQYVYDVYDNLTYVLPPKGTDIVLTENLYVDFTKNISPYDYLFPARYLPGTATGTSSIALSGTNLTFSVDIQFANPMTLELGPIVQLPEAVPNVDLNVGANLNGYELKIENGYLTLSSTQVSDTRNTQTQVNGLSGTFTVTLPEYTIEQEVIDELCYQYHYDSRNRLIEKKIPGKGWEYIVYDKLDRPVLTQDANQRKANHWLFVKYDVFNRAIYTGRHVYDPDGDNTNSDRLALQALVNAQSEINEAKTTSATIVGDASLHYDNDVYPNLNMEVYTINYYDDYPQDIATTIPNPGAFVLAGRNNVITNNPKTLSTGSKVRVLGTNDWITSATYYDDKARPIYMETHNDYLNTADVMKMALDFTGSPLETESKHTKDGTTIVVINDVYTYDHAGRLLTQTQSIDDATPELIANNEYDELGQLTSKKVGGTVATDVTESTGLQSVDYKYNIRGWLRQINDIDNMGDDLFNFELSYNTPRTGTNGTPLYNGNISETLWRTKNISSDVRGYLHEYDALNRLKNARGIKNIFGGYFPVHSYYTEGGIKYDKNGNMLKLYRKEDGTPTIDNLYYTYDIGNKLLSVRDYSNDMKGFLDGNITGDDYDYDTNGNMVKDLNKGIIGATDTDGITYNHLNLPTSVTFDGDPTKNISYIYDATGVKQAKVVTNGSSLTTTKYAGNFIYEQAGVSETLKFFNHPEGYVQPTSAGGFEYVYQYKDHLGNVRLSYLDSNDDNAVDTSEIVEESNYYPFGLKHKGYNDVVSANVNSIASKFKYNGKELEESFGYNMYEMDVRSYDPAIARWTAIDPVTHHSLSTYNAFDNNPVFYADPSGADSNPGNQGLGRTRLHEHMNVYNFGMSRTEVSAMENGTYQLSQTTTVSSSIIFNPEREGDNRGQQVVETKYEKTSRYLQDKKIIQVNELLIYETVLDDEINYGITSYTEYYDKSISIFGRGGKKEKTIDYTAQIRNVDPASAPSLLHLDVILKTQNTSRHYNKAVPLLAQEYIGNVFSKISSGYDIKLPIPGDAGQSLGSIPGNPSYGRIGSHIGEIKSSDIQAQVVKRQVKSTMLRKTERIKL